jgi:ribonuclease Z
MGIQVSILGSNSAIPTANRRPTSQVVSVNNEYFLVDCGEATQIQMRLYGIKFQRISRIFISHMHGDHYFGLIGLLNTMHLLTREKELHIHGPKGLKEIIDLQLKVANSRLRFPLHFHLIEGEVDQLLYEDTRVEIWATPVKHRIPCFGFVFTEKQKTDGLRKEAIDEFGLSIEDILKVKRGESVQDKQGSVIDRSELVIPAEKPRKYAFITDTKPSESYQKAIEGADLLYHEATFAKDQEKRAVETFHTTASQAAEVALNCACKKLIIGHFSTRYKSLEPLLKEAKEIFKNTELAEEGKVFDV